MYAYALGGIFSFSFYNVDDKNCDELITIYKQRWG